MFAALIVALSENPPKKNPTKKKLKIYLFVVVGFGNEKNAISLFLLNFFFCLPLQHQRLVRLFQVIGQLWKRTVFVKQFYNQIDGEQSNGNNV